MSDTVSPNGGAGWTANAALGGPQHEALYGSRPIYQAAGARRAPAHDAQNTPSDVYVSTHADAQYAIGILCAGLPESFFGGLAAQELGAALHEWIWQHRANPPVEREATAFINSLQAGIADRINTQALSGLLNRGGPADLLRRREQLGSQTSAGFYILGLDGSVMFYLLGNLRILAYSTDLTIPPSAYTGNRDALWSSRNGLVGAPVARTLRPVQGVSLNVADLPTEWGRDFKLLYQPAPFSMAAAATAATVSVGFVTAMIDPRMGPTTATTAPQPFMSGSSAAPEVQRATRPVPYETAATSMAAPADPIPFRPTGGAPTRSVPVANEQDAWDRGLDMDGPAPPRGGDDGLDGLDSLSYMDDDEESSLRPPSSDAMPSSIGLNRHSGGTTTRTGGMLASIAGMGGSTRLIVGGAIGVLALVFLCAALAAFLNRPPDNPGIQSRLTPTVPAGALYFKETNSIVQGRFKEVWESDGGIAVFGLPLTNTRSLGTLRVQDFQRFRFESHPTNTAPYDVLFANLGLERFQQLGHDPDQPAERRGETNCRWFADVQHNVCGAFLDFWTKHGRNLGPGGNPEAGSLALFGTPISEERKETIGGQELTVQWFQKARFELHPEAAPDFQVQLGLLGAEMAPPGAK
jgi:hypothetical protein